MMKNYILLSVTLSFSFICAGASLLKKVTQGALIKKELEHRMEQWEKVFEFDANHAAGQLFDYPLSVEVVATPHDLIARDGVTVTFHGSGASKQHGRRLKERELLRGAVITFNFPEHDIDFATYDFTQCSFGTIRELLPALFVLKQCLDHGVEKINVYGFSAGGGVVINAISVLNGDKHEDDLARIGILKQDRKSILQAMSKGRIILDCPLKSIEELMDYRGYSDAMNIMAHKYRENDLRPIDRLDGFAGLAMNVLLYFEQPDEILSNRDDQLYYERLRQYNQKGRTILVEGTSGGHSYTSNNLWQEYRRTYGKDPQVSS